MPYFFSGERASSRLSVTTARSCHGRLQLLRVRLRSEKDCAEEDEEAVLERLRVGMSIGSEVAFLLMVIAEKDEDVGGEC